MLTRSDYDLINKLKTTQPDVFELINKISNFSLETTSHACHDIQNYSGLISGYCQLISLKHPEFSQTPEFMKIQLANNSLLEFLQSFADYRYSFKQISTEKIKPTKLCESACNRLSEKYSPVKISIVSNISENKYIHADTEKLEKAVFFILENAAQENLVSEINVKLSEIDDELHIVITDNGPGFSETILNTATKPFATERKKHTGLGLSIAANILYMHKGDLKPSNTDNGSKVTLILPLYTI